MEAAIRERDDLTSTPLILLLLLLMIQFWSDLPQKVNWGLDWEHFDSRPACPSIDTRVGKRSESGVRGDVVYPRNNSSRHGGQIKLNSGIE